MEDLLRRLDQLRPLFEDDFTIVAVYLFGSQVEGYVTPRSDIDLAVLWDEPVTFRTELDLDAEISLALGTDKVDVVNLSKMPLALQYRVIATGRLLYEREPVHLADFVQQTLVRYFDFQPTLQTYEQEFLLSLEHDYGV